MKRKIYISGLILILLVSTTGLTYTFHLCRMMDFDNAELCKMSDMKMMSSFHFEDKDSGQTFKKYHPDCCEFRTVEKRISDEFLSLKTEISSDKSSSLIFVINELLSNILNSDNFNTNNLHNNSPPGRTNNLFEVNSSFLI